MNIEDFMRLFPLFLFFWIYTVASDIAVISMAVGERYRKATVQSIENKKQYCLSHGYDFIDCSKHIDPSRPVPWSKILLMREILEQSSYQWLFWIDADALFMNFDQSIESLIDEDYYLIASKDYRFPINTGVFLLKNSEWSRSFLERVYLREDLAQHVLWENQAIIELLEFPEIAGQIKILPQRALNSYVTDYRPSSQKKLLGEDSLYQQGDFIVHFTGVRRRLNLLQELITKYDRQKR